MKFPFYWKKILPYICIVLFLIVISYAFVPEVLSGKIVNQSDISGWQGMARESVEWNREHPDNTTQWSGSMFGGMPNVTFVEDFKGDGTAWLYRALLWGRRPATYLFIALLGAFLMMLSLGINKYLSVAGAVAVAFCAYNFQIIQVGHNTKMQAIAFAPWAIAAFVFTYRTALKETGVYVVGKCGGKASPKGWREWLPYTVMGSVLFGFAVDFQVKANHVQITYYLAIILLIYALATLVWVLLKCNRDRFGRFAAASGLLLVMGVAGIGTNADKLIPTAGYAPYTMRGGSELSGEQINADGLSLDYATAWSYGIEEMPNLMIPNYNGGSSSGSVGKDSATWNLFRRAGQNPSGVCSNLPLYWGPQPFTAGPMYLGAISVFLFILGLCLVRGREKWWLLACCVVAVLLSWGNHFLWFTKLWFDYAPMYNKFRTVSMALVALQFCVPLLGVYVLDRIIKEEYPQRDVVKALWVSFGVTAGFCLIAALFPSLAGDFTAPSDGSMQDVVAQALRQDRRHLLQLDAWRSFLLITSAAALLMWCYLKPDPSVRSKRFGIAASIIAVLVLFDLWSVGKRYLNEDDFIRPRDFSAKFNERDVDREILADKSPSYRVLDLSENTFNSSLTSYRHKSIGGYSPAKMQRYQDLIERYLTREIKSVYSSLSGAGTLDEMQDALPYMPVLSMLNGKYIILDAKYPPLVNPYAFGPAWLVSQLVCARDADGEIAALDRLDLHNTAVVRTEGAAGSPVGLAPSSAIDRFVVEAGEEGEKPDNTVAGRIEMTSYAPNEVCYRYDCVDAAIAVFSEIYHPSWKASIDGRPLELFRVDWVLRGAVIPAGKGEIVMRYEPEDYAKGAALSRASSILLFLLLAASLLMMILTVGKRKEI